MCGAVDGWPCRSAAAQGLHAGRIAIEAVAAVATSSRAADDPFVFLDLATTVRLTDELDVIVRPYARRLPGGGRPADLGCRRQLMAPGPARGFQGEGAGAEGAQGKEEGG